MKWRNRRESSNVEDNRRSGGPKMIGAGGGITGIIIMVVIVYLSGGNLGDIAKVVMQQGAQQAGNPQQPNAPIDPAEDELASFVKVVLADTEDVWHELFRKQGKTYIEPKLVMFKANTRSGCGLASSASGPFYCPADSKVYIDLAFFQVLKQRFQAPGDFAQAYVIAHEVGHHVQHLQGITDKVHSMKDQVSEAEYNELSVRLELQADFYAGVFAHHAQKTKQILDPGDIEEALTAASAIGDDKIQMQSKGYVDQESFTHGSAAQRVRWFRKGFESGKLSDGNTFDAKDL